MATEKKTKLWTGIIILRVKKNFISETAQTLPQLFNQFGVKSFDKVFDDYNIEVTKRLLFKQSIKDIREYDAKAAENGYERKHSMLQYWMIYCKHLDKSDFYNCLNEISQAVETDKAYPLMAIAEPGTIRPVDGTDPLIPDQLYLKHAPYGVNTQFPWKMGFDGNGTHSSFPNGNILHELERGWMLTHEDLVGQPITIVEGVSDSFAEYDADLGRDIKFIESHGTSTLGIICAADNGIGLLGMAPGINSVKLYSAFKVDSVTPGDADEAAGNMAGTLEEIKRRAVEGDIVLIEQQVVGAWNTETDYVAGSVVLDYYPLEGDDACYDQIYDLITVNKATVIVPAGNGNVIRLTAHDMDSDLRLSTDTVLLVEDDSGSIMVAAANSSPPYLPVNETWPSEVYTSVIIAHYATNFGSRVNCFAHGRSVVTCGLDDTLNVPADDDKEYTNSFALTSSAAAIIAGCALIIQGAYKETFGECLSPAQMRSLLSDPSLGTLSANSTPASPNADKIGVMPDLKKIFKHLGLCYDIYMRDNSADIGTEPSSGNAWETPDIIVDTVELNHADAYAKYIDSGHYDSYISSSNITRGTNHWVYVRHQNLGNVITPRFQTRVFYSNFSTINDPSTWNEIGTAVTDHVDDMEEDVSAPLWWDTSAVPTGNYCLFAITNSPLDNAPPIPTLIPDFATYVSNHNNVAWRNISIIDISAPVASYSIPFSIRGANFEPADYGFNIERFIPIKIKMILEIPEQYQSRFPFPFKKAAEGRVQYELPAVKNFEISKVKIGGKEIIDAILIFKAQKASSFKKLNNKKVSVIQKLNAKVIGGVTFLFKDLSEQKTGNSPS